MTPSTTWSGHSFTSPLLQHPLPAEAMGDGDDALRGWESLQGRLKSTWPRLGLSGGCQLCSCHLGKMLLGVVPEAGHVSTDLSWLSGSLLSLGLCGALCL